MREPRIRQIHRFNDISGIFYSAVFLKSKPELYIGCSRDTGLYVFNTEQKSLKNVYKTDYDVLSMDKTPEENLIVIAGAKKVIDIICTKSHRIHKKIVLNDGCNIFGIQCAPDNKHFYFINSKILGKYSLQDFKLKNTYQSFHPSERCCLALANNQKHIYGSIAKGKSAGKLDLKRRKIHFLNQIEKIRCHQLSTNNRLLISGSHNSQVSISDVFSKKLLKKVYLFSGGITCIRSTRKWILCGGFNNSMIILSSVFPFNKLDVFHCQTYIFHLAVSNDEKQFILGGYQNRSLEICSLEEKSSIFG